LILFVEFLPVEAKMKFPRILLLALLVSLNVTLCDPAAAQNGGAVEVKVKNLLVDPNSQVPVVVLESVGDKRLLPIWIDVPEARAISMEMERVKTVRPLTHDLIRNILQGLGATVHRVTVTDLRKNTYIATISLTFKGQESQIDSRPSDAIAIALRMKAPIYVAAQVLEKSQPLPAPASRTEQTQKRLGIHAQDLTPELAKLMDSQTQRGVIVADVVIGSVAMNADMRRGDIIVKLNDHRVSNTAELEATIQAAKSPGQMRFELIKKGKPTTVVIDLP
jgi:hypothetical protein